MFRDRGSTYQLGYGVQSSDVTRTGEQEGIDPNSGFIAKALHGHPFMRFLAVSAVTLVGVEVAGSLVKKGGVKLGEGLLKGALEGRQFSTTALQDFRKTQGLLDSLQGLTRVKGALGEDVIEGLDPLRRSILEDIGDPRLDQTAQLSGFFFTQAEQAKAVAQGLDASAAHWTLRDELQQRLVGQARRLPYELPAAYLTQRGLTDRVFGENQNNRPNWKSPVDVLGDFASQSLKNMTALLLPFEAGKGAAQQGWRRMMTSSFEDSTHLGGLKQNVRDLSVGLDRSLRLVGHDMGDVLFRASQKSQQFTGAFSTALNETAAGYQTATQNLTSRVKAMRAGVAKPLSAQDLPVGISEIFKFQQSFRHSWQDIGQQLTEAPVSTGRTSVERLSKTLGQFSNPSSTWFQNQLRGEYRTLFGDELRGMGISDADADRFARLARFRLPSRELVEKGRGAQSAVAFGEGATIPGDASFADHVKAQLTHAKGFEKPDLIAQNIETATRRADQRYVSQISSIRSRVMGRGAQARVEVLGRSGDILGSDRLPYQLFQAPFAPQVKEQLIRMSSRELGISTQDQLGGKLSTSALKGRPAARGVDASDAYQMRALLQQSKRIGAPWRPDGRNIFGLRRLSAEEALQKGFFGDRSKEMEQTVAGLRQARTFSTDFHRTPLKGVYETAGGRTLDTNVFSKGFWRGTDLIANEFQIPFIHFRPFQALGYQTFREIREAGPVMLQSGAGHQPFLGSQPGSYTDSYFWFRQGRGMKGRVTQLGERGPTELPGLYRPMPADSSQFVGRAMRQAAGDVGRAPAQGRNWFQKAFDIDEDQASSIPRLVKRFRERRADTGNLTAFARMISEGDIAGLSKKDMAEGVQNLVGKLRQTGYTTNVVKQLQAAGYGDLFQYTTRKGELLDFVKAKDADQLRSMVDKFLAEEEGWAGDRGLNRDVAAGLRRARGRLAQAPISDEPVASNVRSTSIHRRMDEFRNELYQYLATRRALTSGLDMNQAFGDIDTLLRKLQRQGSLTGSEVTEARAALLSTQLNFEGFKAYESGVTDQDLLLRQAGSLLPKGARRPAWMEPPAGQLATSPVLRDLAEGRSPGPVWRKAGRRVLGGISDYKYPGTRYNPFGSGTVFVPTFGTVAERVGVRRAAQSALGFTTWNDPAAFSGAGIPLTHGFTRLNTYMSGLNLGLDAGAYKGPLDYYARGLVGKRVLPLVATGTTALMMDRQIGGMVNPKDAHGKRVYSPFFLGIGADIAAQAQVGAASILPGGETGDQKRQELLYGDVPVRKGRWWPLGNTPFKGGNEMYFRPSWYRRLQSGYLYTDQAYGKPLDRLMHGFDFSPLRPLDPYRFERQHYADRPYPVTGEYFTGPWGPLTSALNMTVGRVLKPRVAMHQDEVAANLASYVPVGQAGMASPGDVGLGPPVGQSIGGAGFRGGGGGGPYGVAPQIGGGGAGLRGPLGAGTHPMLAASNQVYERAAAAGPRTTAAAESRGALARTNSVYMAAAGTPASSLVPGGRIPFGTMMAAPPLSPQQALKSQLGYEFQETMGIYGFSFASARSALGFGNQDLIPQRPVLASAGQAYGSGRQFWDLNLGGLGDVSTPVEGEYANIEFGEIARRFIPRPRALNEVNPIRNTMALQAPWLPDTFKFGDPFSSIAEGELRLPGTGYERTHQVTYDQTGQYSLATRFAILGGAAPYSGEYAQLDKQMDQMQMSPTERALVEQTRQEVAAVRQQHDFTPYKYRDTNYQDAGMNPVSFKIAQVAERARHLDTFINRKFVPDRTATEDWERNDVFGATFPRWQNPVKDYLKPMVYKAADRGAFTAGATLGAVSGLFWRSPKMKLIGTITGAMVGSVIGGMTTAKEAATGQRWIPDERKQEFAVEEYSDILSYVKAKKQYEGALASGDQNGAGLLRQQMKQTMYGADLYGSTAEDLSQAVPTRKREHFLAMIQAPEQERARVLSTAPRLERRIYEAAWGMPVEKRPDLPEYFTEHELPAPDWEGWSPDSSMDAVKLKIIQSQGLEAAQMGYYPQQVQQANLVNPSYPDFNAGTVHSPHGIKSRLHALMANEGVSGSVVSRYSPFPGVHLQMNAS